MLEQLDSNQNIWILGHIPIGSSEANKNFTNYFYEIVQKYDIKYQFWGHTHQDYFTIVLKDDIPKGFSFICPSIMFDNRYSSFRQYELDDNFDIVNYKSYIADLNKVISNDKVEYELYYSAKDSFQLNSFDKKSYFNLYNRMKYNDTLIQIYHKHYNPGFNNYYCDKKCKQSYLNEIIMYNF